MNKWHELRKWLEEASIVSSKDVLQKMDELDEEAIKIAELSNEHVFEVSEEDLERWNEYQKEQREKYPWFYDLMDKVAKKNRGE